MRNRKAFAIMILALAISCMFTACGLFDKDEDQGKEPAVSEVTPTPEPTSVPEPTPTIAPDAQTSIYQSSDKAISMKLPDATWGNKIDEADMYSFESPEQGKILITHGAGEEDMSVAVLPSTQDMAVSLEQAADLVQGTDFEIQDYSATDVNGVNVYSYVTKMLNTEKSGGYAYVVNKVFANADEYYTIVGSVKTEDALAGIKGAVESFAIVGNSSLKNAAPGSSAGAGEETGDNGAAGADGQDADGSDAQGSEGQGSDSQGSGGSGTGIMNGGFSDAQLTDTSQTRTIYRNSDGAPLVITPNGNGGWVDSSGNTYEFANDEDVYDQDGVDYYYHGEAADVYYMPVE